MKALDLDTLTLAAGDHYLDGEEMCVMEAVAFIAGEKWTDRPECASPVIGAFMRAWNDVLPDDDRQDLKRYILRLVNSRGTAEQEDLRGWMALDWLVRVYIPAWLRLAGLDEHADRLAGFAEIRPDTVRSVKPALDAAVGDARAVMGAALAVARAAARAAAGAAREAAAGAAREAAVGTSWAAMWAAARGNAAVNTAWDLTHRELQQSAHELVDRMLAVTEGDPA